MSEEANIVEKKSEDKKGIELEEQEKMLNEVNESLEKGETIDDKKKDIKEGMEVKPKKIPIGGIQMPGFFTRSKSKERCKEGTNEAEVEGAELIENSNKTENATSQARIKLPNPFRKSKLINEGEGDKTTKQKDKTNLLETIRLPLVSVFSRTHKDSNLENQVAKAGLASMETLDDKSMDGKDNTELTTVVLDDKKDTEKQTPNEETSWMQKLRTYRIAVSALLTFILIIIIITIIATQRTSVLRSAPLKDGKFIEALTSCGKVEGVLEDSAFAFRGIPYARSPIGDLRFKHAQRLDRLEYCWNGTILTHNATDPCLQILSNGSVIGIEDCLTLDVVTPYVRYENPLPVIVLIGAESLTGGSPGKMRPSARYARSKDVVFVRPNFRLGALGFLALEALSKDDYPHSSGNYGLSDIIEALRWIQLNIEHFGGDKNSVTLFGHRAGATLVTALATTDARKYFSRAWATSGGAVYPQKPREDAEKDNISFLTATQCTDAKCLRLMDAEKLVSAVEDTWRKPQPDLPSKTENPEERHQWLVVDGIIIKEYPAEVWKEMENESVRLILGSTAQASSSEKLFMKHKNWTESLVKQHVTSSLLGEKNLTEDVFKMYPLNYKGLSTLVTDIRTVCPLYAISTQMTRVPFYVVTQGRGEQNIADIDSDVDAILGRYEPKTAEERRYFTTMQNLFYYYAYHGKVEHNMIGQNVLIVEQDVLPNATYSNCAYWILKNIVLTYAALD